MRIPLVSVLMAARNHEQYVETAVASVLGQTYENVELIAIDDASEDATPDLLDALAQAHPGRVRVVRHSTQQGIGRTRTEALGLAGGEFIGLLDSDDQWIADKLEAQVPVLSARPEVGLVHSAFEAFDSATDRTVPWPGAPFDADGDPLRELFVHGCFVMTGTALIRRSAIESRGLGFFNSDYPSYDDYLLYLALALDWRFAYVPRVAMRYRRHPGNLTNVLFADNVHVARVRLLERFAQDFPECQARLGDTRRRALAAHMVQAAAHDRAAGKWATGLRHLAGAARRDPRTAAGLALRAGRQRAASRT